MMIPERHKLLKEACLNNIIAALTEAAAYAQEPISTERASRFDFPMLGSPAEQAQVYREAITFLVAYGIVDSSEDGLRLSTPFQEFFALPLDPIIDEDWRNYVKPPMPNQHQRGAVTSTKDLAAIAAADCG